MELSQAPIPSKNIVFTEFEGGEAILVDLTAKRYYQLNETAALMWRCLEKSCSTDEIVRKITELYNVNEEQAAASINRFLNELKSLKLTQEMQ